ncbi:glutamyl aminopeptidase-like [Mya arenaria]|uniref:glutamyl aminopeptidase-like n=1 Tax=Mya arenaria TaxID=6604 RepID=UPI0022E7218A|nr:glutamyl aminopeptidase-like [Mya arenaria]
MDTSKENNEYLKVANGCSKPKEEGARSASFSKSISGSCTLKEKETIVTIQDAANRCVFSRTQVFVTLLAFFFLSSVLVVLVVFKNPGFGSSYNRYFKNGDGSLNTECACANIEEPLTHDVKTETPSTVLTANDENKALSRISTHPELRIRLPGNVIPRHYDLDLDIYIDEARYKGSVKMYVNVTVKTSLVIFHVKPYLLRVLDEEVYIYKPSDFTNEKHLDVISADVIKHFTDFDKEVYAVQLKSPLEVGEYVIYVRKFEGHIFADLKGIYMSSYKTTDGDERSLVASQLQSTDARKVFPCFDEPAMKATFTVSITHDASYTALSNMPVRTVQCVEECTRRRAVFETTPVMSTYLLAFVVSDFKYTETFLNTSNTNYTLRIWSQPDLINQTYYALNFAKSTYVYFTDYFDMPDVLPKADHVAVPDFSGGAMENWGLVIYRETALLYDPDVSSSSNKYMVTLIVAHEIAHTWFGNMVTMKWWSDLWLNEGFASTLMYFAMDHEFPEWNVLEIVVVEDMFPVMVKDALVTSHPVSPNIEHPDEIAESFDQISYNKGMAILRMLETFLGKEGFRLGLQMYVRKYKFDNADQTELWHTFSQAMNYTVNISSIMDTWTRQMGYPVIHVRRQDGFYILEQERFLMDTPTAEDTPSYDSEYGYLWRVPFTYKFEGDTDHKLIWLNMGPGKVPIPEENSSGWILGNLDYGGFYRVNYELDMWGQLGRQLNEEHSVFSLANRAGLIGDAFNLARASRVDYGLAFNMTTYLAHEDNYVPWKAFLDCIDFIQGMLSKTSAYVLLQKYIGNLVSPVIKKIGMVDGGNLPQMYIRRMLLRTGCDVGVADALEYSKQQFRDWMINGTRLPTDIAQVIYSVGVAEGSVEEWDHVWSAARKTQSPSEREMLLEALSYTQKPWLLWRYANWIFDGNKIKLQDVRLVMNYFSNTPLGRMIALHFLMNRWDDLNDKFGEDTFIIREMIGQVTQYVNTEFELRQLELLFREKPPKGARQGADHALALIRANINWMDRYYPEILAWLEERVESSF